MLEILMIEYFLHQNVLSKRSAVFWREGCFHINPNIIVSLIWHHPFCTDSDWKWQITKENFKNVIYEVYFIIKLFVEVETTYFRHTIGHTLDTLFVLKLATSSSSTSNISLGSPVEIYIIGGLTVCSHISNS